MPTICLLYFHVAFTFLRSVFDAFLKVIVKVHACININLNFVNFLRFLEKHLINNKMWNVVCVQMTFVTVIQNFKPAMPQGRASTCNRCLAVLN